jgi:nucleoside-diphosphate-sugar epimerase
MISHVPINPNASALFGSAIGIYQKVLVLGASGWFGRTALSMMGRKHEDSLLIGGSERAIRVEGRQVVIREWAEGLVERFQPDLVLDFAFLTKDKIPFVGAKEFSKQNAKLSERLFLSASFPSVKKVVTVSSGAAVHGCGIQSRRSGDSYGRQKAHNEGVLRVLASALKKDVVVARAWSVSGGHTQAPENFAFSDFVLSALRSKNIRVASPQRVFRRYCSVEDFLAVAMAAKVKENYLEFDSGGPLIELEGLAKLVASDIGGASVEVTHSIRGHSDADNYFSDGADWTRLCLEIGLTPLDLLSQIRNVREALSPSRE